MLEERFQLDLFLRLGLFGRIPRRASQEPERLIDLQDLDSLLMPTKFRKKQVKPESDSFSKALNASIELMRDDR